MNAVTITTFFNHQKYMWAVIFIPLLFLACGYRFSGSGNLPGGIQTIAVEIFENRTPETGLENTVTNALIYEFSRHGNVVISCDGNVGGVLGGTLKSTRIETISRSGIADSTERRVTLKVDMRLTNSGGEIVWTSGEMTVNEEYAVDPDKLNTEQNRGDAFSALSKRLAETAYHRLMSGF